MHTPGTCKLQIAVILQTSLPGFQLTPHVVIESTVQCTQPSSLMHMHSPNTSTRPPTVAQGCPPSNTVMVWNRLQQHTPTTRAKICRFQGKQEQLAPRAHAGHHPNNWLQSNAKKLSTVEVLHTTSSLTVVIAVGNLLTITQQTTNIAPGTMQHHSSSSVSMKHALAKYHIHRST